MLYSFSMFISSLTLLLLFFSYQMATGSEDNSVKIWDLRQRKCLYTIPSHTGLVSKVKFQPSNGLYLVTSSYDKTAKIWNHPNWAPSQVLAGHEGRLMCVDVSRDDKFIATASFEKNFKLWAPEVWLTKEVEVLKFDRNLLFSVVLLKVRKRNIIC